MRRDAVLPYAQAQARFLRKEWTPRDYLEQCIDRIERLDADIGAFVCLDIAAARQQADESTLRYQSGAPLGPVDGMPFGVKDIIATVGMPTEMNSPLFKNHQPKADAAGVRAMRRAGAVLVGKTATTELAIGSAAKTVNPWDATRTPGGSSSGAAASVGAGMVPAGLGTQSQGSIVRPASYCGAVGFKPTWGTLATEGLHPVSPSHDHLGVIADSVDTAWWTAQALAQAPNALREKFADIHEPITAVRPRSVAVLRTASLDELDDASAQAFEAYLAQLARQGVQVIDPSQSALLQEVVTAMAALPRRSADMVAYEMQTPYGSYADRHPDLLGERILGWLQRAEQISDADYAGLLRGQCALRRQYQELATSFDAVVLPAASGPAPQGLTQTGSRSLQVYGTYLGVPSCALPTMKVDRMPLGAQVMGYDRADHRLMCHAKWLMSQA